MKEYLIRLLIREEKTGYEQQISSFRTGSLDEAKSWLETNIGTGNYDVWERDLEHPLLEI